MRWRALPHPLRYLVVCAAALACFGDTHRSPMDALQSYFEEHTSVGADVLDHRSLLERNNQAVFVTRIEQGDSTEEWYSFLTRAQKGWQVDTTRTLQFPKSYYARIDSIQEGLLTDSLLSPADANLPLTVATDSTIKAYLLAHQAILDSVVDLFMKRAVLSTIDVAVQAAPEIRDGTVLPTNRNERVQDLLERAKVTRIFRDARYPHCTFIRINGIARTEVGYVYADDGCVAPDMNPDSFIYVEQAAEKWYVYKVI